MCVDAGSLKIPLTSKYECAYSEYIRDNGKKQVGAVLFRVS